MARVTEFETLEHQFLELIAEFRTITISGNRLRDSLRTESSRAEAAEAGRAAAERTAAEARSSASAATAAVNKATSALANAQEQLTGLKIHLELTERQRATMEERCTQMSTQINSLERQLQQLRPLQPAHAMLQKQYTDLQERILNASEEARRESSRLESELRRVEKCNAAGSELRERARLAAAAHAREKRLANTELQHTNRELLNANAEISKLRATVAELQIHLTEVNKNNVIRTVDPNIEVVAEIRAALEAERAGTTKLERALAAALADNATLASRLHATDNTDEANDALTPTELTSTNISSIRTMIQKFGVCVFFVALTAPLVQCISVIGPRALRPFSSYTVAIAGSSRSYSLYVAIEGRRANGEQYNLGREVQVPAATSRVIELEIGDPGPGQYALVARSTSGPLFSSSASLLYQPRSFCIFVQTDKRVYQPGDTINFRVIALDKYLLPLSTTVDVSVLDSGGSPIRQWAAADLDRGVLTQELVLADEPALGKWTIQVEARGQKYSHDILVADYVLPKFHLEMHLPKEVLFSEGRFDINVTAKHFNGHPVRGELTISAYPVFFSGLLQPVVAAPTRKVVEINGQTDVTFDLKTDLDLAEDAARPLVVEAVLEEKDTLIKQNISSRILLLRAPYRLRVSAPNYFKPALPYIVQVEVVDPSGQLINTDGEVTVERLWDDGTPANVTQIPLNKGIATYTLVPDKGHVNSTLNLLIKYKEVTERVVHVQRNEYTSQYLTAEVLTRNTSVGDEMRARITATEPMDLVHYAVIGRGDIIVAKTIELSPARKSVDVTASVTSRMAPGCIFLAWYRSLEAPRNNLLSAAVYSPQKDILQNQVLVSPVSTNGASPKPNTLVELRVLGEAGALVSLLAEDTRSIDAGIAQSNALGSGLDINKIERETESFNSLPHSVFKNEDHLSSSGIDLGGFTTSDVFKNAGVVILTDGVVVKNNQDGSVSSPAPVETGTRPPLAGPYAFSRLPPPPSPRYYLTVSPQPTWMLANLTIGNDGNGAKERWTAETPGEFSIGAFSVHPTLGLGLATPQKFTTSVPLALDAELPSSLQRGETVAAVVILKTTLAVDTPVEVTFYNSDQYFEFEPLDNELENAKKIELFRRIRVTVPARGSISTAFLVTVVRSGEAPVIIEASGNGVSASLFRTIAVKDGYEEDLWAWSLLDARKTVARANVTLNVRPGVKAGAISLRATGDLLASALQATKAPIAPSADAIHALRPLALACVLLDHLQATGQAESATTKEARALAAAGYQRLMAYRRLDGSFAAEHDAEAEGDVW
ncbi:unnamed protein product [Arctia plantaginis]|uniref:TEP1-F n=1 Tax=Arctia plantaginis TaxID=874455 RepID=A0A8S1AXD4_ARCPL|nr:unnamed protein product [Arctia plantaginis]